MNTKIKYGFSYYFWMISFFIPAFIFKLVGDILVNTILYLADIYQMMRKSYEEVQDKKISKHE